MIEVAKAKNMQGVELLVGDCENPPFPENSFDVLISIIFGDKRLLLLKIYGRFTFSLIFLKNLQGTVLDALQQFGISV